jgi:hypothetical protein
VALLLSFIVAGIFWFSHQRRLAYAPEASRPAVIVNLLFLLSIIVLPVTAGLYGTYMEAPDVITLYGAHLTLISALNAFLWLNAVAPRGDWLMAGGAAFPMLVFIVASIVGLFAPQLPKFLWPLAFVAPIIASYLERKRS